MTDSGTAGPERTCTASVGVVVCTYDLARFDMLLDCLRSLACQTLTADEIIVVVDGNPDLAAKLDDLDLAIEVVSLERNGGVSRARNAGMVRASSQWLAFLDDDAIAEPDWLERLFLACHASGAVGAGGVAQPWYEDEASEQLMPKELLWTVGCSYQEFSGEPVRVRNVMGGCALMRADVLQAVGGFNEHYGRVAADFGGSEEADLCLRIAHADATAFFLQVPDAVIHHFVPRSRARARYVLGMCRHEGRSKGEVAREHGLVSLAAETRFVQGVPAGMVRLLRARRPAAAALLGAGVAAAAVGFAQDRLAWMLTRGRAGEGVAAP